jgi:hypothetical protein
MTVRRAVPGLRRAAIVPGLFSTAVALLIAGCSGGGSTKPPVVPGRAKLPVAEVSLPAQLIGNLLIIEAKGDRQGPLRFLIDTGSSVNLVTPALARRFPGRNLPGTAPALRVAGADGSVAELPRASLPRLELGAFRFEEVDVLLHDCAGLSAHLGIPLDGVLGFPLFREVLLTLDYPRGRVVLRPARTAPALPGVVVPFDDARKTPLVTVRLGDRSLVALIDSGSDACFSLNPVGLAPVYTAGPRPGATVQTLAGEHPQLLARLADPLSLGGHEFVRPIVELTDELSSLGGGFLRHFTVSFDQQRDRVILERSDAGPIVQPPLRSTGLSFSRKPAYWRVDGVVPDSPASRAGLQPGDLVIRLNAEPVTAWDFRRYERLVATAREAVFTLLVNGRTEVEKRVALFDLIP